MTHLRVFNEAGLNEASNILARMRDGEISDIPADFLGNVDYSSATDIKIGKPRKDEIKTRWDLAWWLYRQLDDVDDGDNLFNSSGVWSWLAFHLLDTICPPRSGGRRPKHDARYILNKADYRRSYRHLVAGPYFMIRAHQGAPTVVKGLLATPPDAPGDVYEQLASRKEIVTSQSVMYAVTTLYWDPDANRLRRGAAGSGPGSARRLAEIMMQYDLTYDLYEVNGKKLVSMLPKEFSRFVNPSPRESAPNA